MPNVGKRIKERRLQLGLNAESLARLVGLSPATIYRYEKHEIEKVNTTKLEPIAKALKTTGAYLMGWVDDPDALLDSEGNTPNHSDILYISRPSGDMATDELRKYLHEVIDQLDDESLTFFKDITIRIKP